MSVGQDVGQGQHARQPLAHELAATAACRWSPSAAQQTPDPAHMPSLPLPPVLPCSCAGLNVMGLIHSHAAAALQYGIERDFSNRTERVVLYDMGSGTVEAALVKFSAYTDKKVRALCVCVWLGGGGGSRRVLGLHRQKGGWTCDLTVCLQLTAASGPPRIKGRHPPQAWAHTPLTNTAYPTLTPRPTYPPTCTAQLLPTIKPHPTPSLPSARAPP